MLTFLPTIHHPSRNPDAVTLDGVTYRRIERLPRNVRSGDLVRLFDGNDPRGPREAYVPVDDVDSWPRRVMARGRVSMAEVRVNLERDAVPWWWVGRDLKFYGSQTHESFTVWRADKRGN